MSVISKQQKLLIGWNEWCCLPSLGIPFIKAKIDTGAKTSTLHADAIKVFSKKGVKYVKFIAHPLQADEEIAVTVCRPVVDQRLIMSSNGHRELRYVIDSTIKLGTISATIQLTLSNREPLRFRMLLGRDAFKAKNASVLIDPSRSLILSSYDQEDLATIYRE